MNVWVWIYGAGGWLLLACYAGWNILAGRLDDDDPPGRDPMQSPHGDVQFATLFGDPRDRSDVPVHAVGDQDWRHRPKHGYHDGGSPVRGDWPKFGYDEQTWARPTVVENIRAEPSENPDRIDERPLPGSGSLDEWRKPENIQARLEIYQQELLAERRAAERS